MTDTSDEIFMRAALEEARKGRYIAPPNPAVGCVIVKDGQIVSRGYTHAPGSQHAEIDAIMNAKQAGIDITGATYYVTLEPCSHYGRTPPCAARLIEERAGRVVAAIEDPNPQVAGKGLEMLRQAGVAVACGVCRDEAYESNIGFFTRMTTGKPWVRLKTAVTLDGRTALYNGASRWITSEEARRTVAAFRFYRWRQAPPAGQPACAGRGRTYCAPPCAVPCSWCAAAQRGPSRRSIPPASR